MSLMLRLNACSADFDGSERNACGIAVAVMVVFAVSTCSRMTSVGNFVQTPSSRGKGMLVIPEIHEYDD